VRAASASEELQVEHGLVVSERARAGDWRTRMRLTAENQEMAALGAGRQRKVAGVEHLQHQGSPVAPFSPCSPSSYSARKQSQDMVEDLLDGWRIGEA
jgi:hypothetical protein